MTRVTRVPLAALAALVPLFLAPSAHARDLEADFEGFRIPDHTVRTLTASADGTFHPARSRDALTSQRSQDLNGALRSQFTWWRDSDALQRSFSASVATSGARDWTREEVYFSLDLRWEERHARTVTESWQVSGQLRRYFEDRPVAVSLAASAYGKYLQSWSQDVTSSTSASLATASTQNLDGALHDARHTVNVSAAVGLGHVRDATGIYDAHVLEIRLRELGAISRPLSAGALQKIAELFYIRPDLFQVFDRPDKRFWHDLERILIEDGAIEGPLQADALLRLTENELPTSAVPSGQLLLRRRGSFVGPVVTATATRDHLHTEIHSVYTETAGGATTVSTSPLDFRGKTSVEQIEVGGQAEFHRPIGPRWQTDVYGTLEVPLLHARAGGLVTGASAQLSYMVTDWWLAWTQVVQARSYFRPDPGRGNDTDQWTVQYDAGVNFYVEDHVALTLSFDGVQNRGPYPWAYSRDERVLLGGSYAFTRWLDAPGLITPLPLH